MQAIPPSYNAVVLEDRAIEEKMIIAPPKEIALVSIPEGASTNEYLSLMEKEKKSSQEPLQYQRGFAENHYKLWMTMRIFLMSGGIVFSCRKSRNIRCHGHGGSCGKYAQDKPCRYPTRCHSNRGLMVDQDESYLEIGFQNGRKGCGPCGRHRRRHCHSQSQYLDRSCRNTRC